MTALILFFYSVLIVLATPALLLYLMFRSFKDVAYRQRFAERFALKLPGTAAQGGIVLHTVSVGEFNAAKPLIKSLLLQYPHLPLTITCTTPTASAAIAQFIADHPVQDKKIMHCYLPFDYPVLMRRWLKFMQPQLITILETELWPNMLASCNALAIPTILVNARLSARSAKGYRRFRVLIQPMLQSISQIMTLDNASARRFRALGASSVEVAGNIKFELDVSGTSVKLSHQLETLLKSRVVWVAGSTHAGEDEMLIHAYQQLKSTFPQLLLVLVPRHPERFEAVAQLLLQRQVKFVRRSANGEPDSNTEIWLGDSMGELLGWYQLADVVFIGGSLIERGGHNPLEAMAFAKPVLSGPYVFNFQQVFQLLQRQGAYFKVRDIETLVDTVSRLIRQPELGRQAGKAGLKLYQQQQGAVARIVTQVKKLLPMAEIKQYTNGSSVAWFDPQLFSDFDLAYFNAEYWQLKGLITGQSVGRNTVWFIRQHGSDASREIVLRHYFRGGLLGKVNKDLFWPVSLRLSRAMAEFRLLRHMRQSGLPVPRPCAALYQPRRFGYSADILIERIPGTTDLSHLLRKQALMPDQWRKLGVLIRRFHQHNVYHSDLNCHNILLDNSGQFWLIDFDKCALRQAGNWQQANLARLLRSLQKEQGLHAGFAWQVAQWHYLLEGYNLQLNDEKL